MWECRIRITRTGVEYERVFPSAFPWETSLAGDGEGKATFKVNDAEHPLPRPPADLFRPNAHSIELRWGDYVAFYGKIDDWEYDQDTGTITVSAIDTLNEAKWRMVDGVGADKYSTLTVTNRTASGAFAAILGRMMQWGPDWQFPIDLPAEAPGSISGSWPFWKKLRISDILQQIRSRGYELFLRPYLASDGTVRMQARVAPKITLGTSSFNLTAAERPISGIRYRVNGSRELTGLQGIGNGTGEDQEMAAAKSDVLDIPIRDAKADFPDLTGDALQDATNAELAANREPLVQWTVKQFTISDQWPPHHAAPGRVWQIESAGNPVIPDGTHTLRVIKASGNLSKVIRTEVQSGT